MIVMVRSVVLRLRSPEDLRQLPLLGSAGPLCHELFGSSAVRMFLFMSI